MVDKIVELLNEKVECPEGVVAHLLLQVRGATTPDLVVENDGDGVFVVKIN